MNRAIAKFQKNAKEQCRVALTEHMGVQLVDLRLYYLAPDGTWKPSQQGIALRRELLPILRQAIEAAQVAAGECGPVPEVSEVSAWSAGLRIRKPMREQQPRQPRQRRARRGAQQSDEAAGDGAELDTEQAT